MPEETKTPTIQLLRTAIYILRTPPLVPHIIEMGGDVRELVEFVKLNWDAEGLTDIERSAALTIAAAPPETYGLRPEEQEPQEPGDAPTSNNVNSTGGQ
jgi:hypothetical protein